MSVLDAVLLLVLLLLGLSGLRRGLVVGAISFAGLVVGGLVGLLLAPPAAGQFDSGPARAVAAVAVVLVLATVGQGAFALAGLALRRRLTWRPVRVADAAGGGITAVLAGLLVAYLLGLVVASGPVPGLARAVRSSQVLSAVDSVAPGAVHTLFGDVRRTLRASGFPEVFAGFGPPDLPAVNTPGGRVANRPAVRRSRRSVVQVLGTATTCDRQVSGSGFVYAPQRVMTNAHVVAGVTAPTVAVGGSGRELPAQVVAYDPGRDVAVLHVPGLDVRALRFAGEAERGDGAVVAGYPEGGGYRAVPARVRTRLTARGLDVYQRAQVTRDVYAVRAGVRPGDSGGPLLAPDGEVYGVVFAAAADHAGTGYALTAEEVSGVAERGRQATTPVSTGGCA
jgi:S1-C subfamily serine protease